MQCFVQSKLVPVIIVRGIYVVDTPIFNGKVLIHMTTNFTSSIIIFFGRVWKGVLILIENAISLMTLVCISISGTCSLVALRLIMIYEKSGMEKFNSLSISAVLILKPLV